MYVVSHQAISYNIYFVFLRVFINPFTIFIIVIIIVKDTLAIIASLGYVVSYIWYDYSCLSWHMSISMARLNYVNKKGRCPLFLFLFHPLCPLFFLFFCVFSLPPPLLPANFSISARACATSQK